MQETEETQVWSLGQEDPLEEGIATHSSFLPVEFHGQRSLAVYSPWGRKESDTTEWLTLSQKMNAVRSQGTGSIDQSEGQRMAQIAGLDTND